MRHGKVLIGTILLGLGAFVLSACSEEENGMKNNTPFLLTPTDTQIKALSGKTFYFAHQSVGYNIVDGIAKVLERRGQRGLLSIKELKAGQPVPQKGLLHSTIGSNGDPESKMSEFRSFLDDHLGDAHLDMAMLKFCYVDIGKKTDVPALASDYGSALSRLSAEHPETRILYSTIPLRVFNRSWKAKIKRLFGMEVWGDEENIKRNEYNAVIREKYAHTGRLADIADWESRYPDGQLRRMELFGRQYAELIPEYTDDGKHLNSYGQQVVAGRLLEFLASQVTEKQ